MKKADTLDLSVADDRVYQIFKFQVLKGACW